MMEERKRKRTWVVDLAIIIGGIAAAGGGILVMIGILVACMSLPLLYGLSILAETEDELLFTSASPTGAHVLEAIRVNTAAIEPYYMKVNRMNGEERCMIYYVRGQEEAEILWLSDTVAQINGVPVDVTSEECFKANARGYFDVMVLVEASDVQWLQMTVCMGGEPRITQERTGVPIEEPVDAWGRGARLNVLQELHWDDELSKKKAGLICTVRTWDGQEIMLPYLWEWTAKEYGNYEFILTGNAEKGYILKPDGFKCSVSER